MLGNFWWLTWAVLLQNVYEHFSGFCSYQAFGEANQTAGYALR